MICNWFILEETGAPVVESEKADEEVLDDPNDAKNAAFNSGEMSQKALESAKYFGSKCEMALLSLLIIKFQIWIYLTDFLFNVANKAGQTVSATAKQIKTTVENVVCLLNGLFLSCFVLLQNHIVFLFFLVSGYNARLH